MKNKKELKLKKLTISKLSDDQKVLVRGGNGPAVTGVGQLSDISDPTMSVTG